MNVSIGVGPKVPYSMYLLMEMSKTKGMSPM